MNRRQGRIAQREAKTILAQSELVMKYALQLPDPVERVAALKKAEELANMAKAKSKKAVGK